MRAIFLKLMTLAVIAAVPVMARAQDAHQINQVEQWYHHYLGRHGEPNGLIGQAALIANGMAPIVVESGFIGGPEYFQRNGSTEPSFIAAVYRDVLGVAATPYQIQNDLVRLHQLNCDRQAFALEFLQTRRVAYQPVAPTVVQYRPAYVSPRPVIVPGYGYRPMPYGHYGPGANIGIRQPGFGLGVSIR